MADAPTNQALDAKTVQARLRDYGLTAHMQVATMMMGGIFALAAITLIDILRSPDLQFMRVTYWVLGVGTEMVALSRQLQRPLLLARASTTEIPLLVTHGVLTLAAFALIDPQTGGPDNWRYVYLLWIGIAMCAWLILRSSIRLMRTQAYGVGLTKVVETFLGHQRTFMRQIVAGLVPFALLMFAVVQFLLRDSAYIGAIVIVINVLTLAWIGYSYVQHERDFRTFENAVEDAVRVESA